MMRRKPFLVLVSIILAAFSSNEVSAIHTVGGLPVNSAAIGDVWTKTSSDGRVVQWIEVLAPPFINLEFRYCDPLSCGNADNYECVANKYIPQFADVLPRQISISPLPGSHAEKIFVKAGPAPGFISTGGYFDPDNPAPGNEFLLSGAPQIGSDGSVTINFGSGFNPSFTQALRALPRQRGQVCGLTEEEYKGFRNTFGNRFDNSYRQYYKIAIVWSKPSSCCSATQEINLNEQRRANLSGWGNLSQPKPYVYTQQKGSWASQKVKDVDFAKSGTVPTAIATALSAFDYKTTPDQVGRELADRGVWQPGKGSDWGRVGEYLRSKGLEVEEINVFTLLDRAGSGPLFFAAYDEPRGKDFVSKTIVVTDYDASQNALKAIDPTSGRRTLSLEKFLEGNPWIYQVLKSK